MQLLRMHIQALSGFQATKPDLLVPYPVTDIRGTRLGR